MKRFIHPSRETWETLSERPTSKTSSAVSASVEEIIQKVRTEGDAALYRYAKQFDNTELDSLALSTQLGKEYRKDVSDELLVALQQAKQNIANFHFQQLSDPLTMETSQGVRCMRRAVPIERVGLYIPGGTAPLFSTLLMLGVPAGIAGCEARVVVSPPPIDPLILVVADMLGIEEIYQVGGAQAIAALAYGTETIQPVSKIFGPGNQYVTAAKQYVAQSGTVAIDLPAGPSEVLVIADESAEARIIAADLLSQAEHGADSQVVLVSLEESQIDAVQKELQKQTETLPRGEIAKEALKESLMVVVDNIEEAIAFSNVYAPEHLIMSVKDADEYIAQIKNAGSVFLGVNTPESFGDYASGTNHTLPTGGAARCYSGVSVSSFQKHLTFQSASREGLENLGPTVMAMAEAEQLEAHRRAVSIRLEE